MSLPPRLYKYQSCSDYSLQNLRHRSVWFSKPETFNDPFDCDINFKIVDVTDESVKAMVVRMDGTVNKSISNDDAVRMALAATEVVKKKQWAEIGVACFAEEYANILMWSHYADNHRGFCLEFDTDHYPFKPAKTETVIKVNYADSYPSLSINDIPQKILDHSISLPKFLLGTKSLHWCYENEWRIFSGIGNKEYPYDKLALTGVYFGCKMKDKDKVEIASILADSPTRIYQMERSNSEFSVMKKEIYSVR
ncbi:MAG: DUF2971 domain-containing protein [Chloroflexi bacterium]|nr:DUF2971 domain-containing protein [Chloroflexota bacterium]